MFFTFKLQQLRGYMRSILHTAKKQYRKFETDIPKKELRGHSPNFHIHVSVSDLYIPTIDLPILLQELIHVDRSWEYINRSQSHECENRD
jgi:hypothetical protein